MLLVWDCPHIVGCIVEIVEIAEIGTCIVRTVRYNCHHSSNTQ